MLEFLFIKIVVFMCGSVLMALEISGSRILAPYFGNTIFVWASLIGVLLTALACGYYVGGKLADRKPSYITWGSIVALAGLFTLSIPFISGPVNRLIAGLSVEDRIGSLLVSSIIFFGPSVLLGMVSPFAIKFNLKNIVSVGNVAGKLYAISTMGNIFGTLFTAFYLINKVGVFSIFIILGLVLLTTSIFIFIFLLKNRALGFKVFIFFLIIALFSIITPNPPLIKVSNAETLVFQKDSFYNHIIVVDNMEMGTRGLRFGKHDQTAIFLDGSHESVHLLHSVLFHLPVVFVPEVKDVLFLGCGGGVVPRNYYYDYPAVDIDVVEIDPTVASISKEYFFLRTKPNLKLFIEDGRRFVQKANKKYDIIVIDVCYSDSEFPFHMLTQEFFNELKKIAKPYGAVCFNIISSFQKGENGLFLSVYKTLQTVFRNVYTFSGIILDESKVQDKTTNFVIIATESQRRLSKSDLYRKMADISASQQVKISNFQEYIRYYFEIEPSSLEKTILLTDDYAPVEYLSAKN